MELRTTDISSQAEADRFYRQVLRILTEAQVPFLLGGAYAFSRYTGIIRETKDLDLFARPSDCPRILELFSQIGCHTEIAASHWLGKIACNDNYVDIIFNSANGVGEVDDIWYEYAVPETVLDVPVLLCPPEETICSKAFVMARNRYDGADVAHLLLACGKTLDWSRLLQRFGAHWRVLYSHLILFGFIYPGERSHIPAWVMQDLAQRLQQEVESPDAEEKICQGTLLAAMQYGADVEVWGYEDGRIAPNGTLTEEEVAEWTEHLKAEEGEKTEKAKA
jgi:hypothetical protein